MKRFLASALSFTLLVSLFTIPAGAASPVGQEHFTDGDYTFTKVSDIGSYAPLNDWSDTGNEDTVYFSDGLLLMRNQEMEYSYLGVDGKLHDLNRGRFDALFPFSDGMAAVVSDNKVGYIDTAGNLVIPCQFDAPLNQVSSPYASSFQNGTAWAFRYREGTDVSLVGWFDDLYGGWAQIDKTGKLLTEYTEDAYMGHTAPNDSVYKQYNLSCPDSTGMGMVNFTEECTAPNVGTFNARFGSSDTGLVQFPSGKKDAYGNDELVLYVVQRKPAVRTRYQSTAELTNAYIADLNYTGFEVTVTNPTDSYDSGMVALVLASYMGSVHFVDYELAPHESKAYDVQVSGHIGNTTKDSLVILGSGWGEYLNADIITFTDDADRDAYRATVPCEREESYYSGTMTQQKDGVRLILCFGQPGDDWLKKYTGIARKGQPFQYDDITHNICKP